MSSEIKKRFRVFSAKAGLSYQAVVNLSRRPEIMARAKELKTKSGSGLSALMLAMSESLKKHRVPK